MKHESRNLRLRGLKITHPRMRILEVFEAGEVRHLTAEDVYRKLVSYGEDIGLGTVYRVLTQFEVARILVKNNFETGQALYELNRGPHHDHMIDVDSGTIIEFISEEIEMLQREVAASHGYVIEGHSLILHVRPMEIQTKRRTTGQS